MSKKATAAACAANACEPSLAELLEQGNVFAADCPSRLVMRHVTSTWAVLSLIALQAGTHRFSELRRKIGGVSERMLAQTLTVLAGDGLVTRKALPVVPPHVEYALTPLGRQAAKKVAALADWINESLPKIMQARDALESADNAAVEAPVNKRVAATPRIQVHRLV